MSRNLDSIWPLIRKDFKHAVARSRERDEASFDLVFRDSPPPETASHHAPPPDAAQKN